MPLIFSLSMICCRCLSDGFRADAQVGGNLWSAAPFGYELENTPFSGGKNRKDGGPFSQLLLDIFSEHQADDRGAQVNIAGDNQQRECLLVEIKDPRQKNSGMTNRICGCIIFRRGDPGGSPWRNS